MKFLTVTEVQYNPKTKDASRRRVTLNRDFVKTIEKAEPNTFGIKTMLTLVGNEKFFLAQSMKWIRERIQIHGEIPR